MSTDAAGITLGHVVERWLEHVLRRMDLSPATLVMYRRTASNIRAWGHDQPVAGLDVAPYAMLRRDAGLAPRTLVLELRIVGIAFRWAQAMRLIPTTLTLLVPRLKVDPNRFELNHRTPTASEALKAIEAMPRDDFRVAVIIMARTGARVGEVVRLRACDLDVHHRLLAFGATDGASKTGIRWFPLDGDTFTILSNRGKKGKDPLLDFNDITAPIQAIERRLIRACDLAGVPRFTPHGLRRLVISRLMRSRVDPGTAATLTGHSIQVMLRHYQVVSDGDRRAAAEAANLGVLEDPDEPVSQR